METLPSYAAEENDEVAVAVPYEGDAILYAPKRSVPRDVHFSAEVPTEGWALRVRLKDNTEREVMLTKGANDIPFEYLNIYPYFAEKEQINEAMEVMLVSPLGRILKKTTVHVVEPSVTEPAYSMMQGSLSTRVTLGYQDAYMQRCLVFYKKGTEVLDDIQRQDGVRVERCKIDDTGRELLIIDIIRNVDRLLIPIPKEKIERVEVYYMLDGELHRWVWPRRHVELYIFETAFEKMTRHCAIHGRRNLEVMGFMLGDVFTYKGKNYSIVRDVVTTDLESTEVSVKFRSDAFEKLFEQLDNIAYDYVLAGWYHSHPGHGCYLSSKDIDTQRRMFNKPFQTAVVVDPLHKEVKAYKLNGEHYDEVSYAVYGKKAPKILYDVAPESKLMEAIWSP